MTLEFNELSFGYEKRLFDNITGVIKSGQVLNVLGVNGIGKTTFARCLLNIIKNYEGTIRYDDIDSKMLSVRERAKKVGYIGVGEGGYVHHSVFDYVLLGCAPELNMFKMPKREEEKKVMKILSDMACEHLANQKMYQLSQGEKQLVSVARILVQNPGVIIFDEPTASLDLGNQRKLIRLIKTLRDSGHIVINITHNPNQAFAIGGYAMLLSKSGHRFGKVDEVMTAANLSELYEIDVKVIEDKDVGRIAIAYG